MAVNPSVVVFDVNETLSDMAPMADRFASVGAPPGLAQVWFASLLRDGFAVTAAGGTERFSTPSDIHGASRAGLSAAWINRRSTRYPAYFDRADIVATDLADLAGQLGTVARR